MRLEVLSTVLGHIQLFVHTALSQMSFCVSSHPWLRRSQFHPTPEHWKMSYKMQPCTSVTSLCLCCIEVGSKFKALREMKWQKWSCHPAAMGRAQFGSPGWVSFTSSLKELPVQNCVKVAKLPGNPRDTSLGILGIQGREKRSLIPSLPLHKEEEVVLCMCCETWRCWSVSAIEWCSWKRYSMRE